MSSSKKKQKFKTYEAEVPSELRSFGDQQQVQQREYQKDKSFDVNIDDVVINSNNLTDDDILELINIHNIKNGIDPQKNISESDRMFIESLRDSNSEQYDQLKTLASNKKQGILPKDIYVDENGVYKSSDKNKSSYDIGLELTQSGYPVFNLSNKYEIIDPNSDNGKILTKYGIVDPKEGKNILDYYRNNLWSGFGGNLSFQNWADRYLPLIVTNGKLDQNKVNQLINVQKQNESIREQNREVLKSNKDNAYNIRVYNEGIKKGIYTKEQFEAAIKLQNLINEYSKYADPQKKGFSIFQKNTNSNYIENFDSTPQGQELLKKISELQAVTNGNTLHDYIESARPTEKELTSEEKRSKSYKDYRNSVRSNIISEINGLEKAFAESVFETLMLEGAGKAISTGLNTARATKYGTKAIKALANAATKVENFGTKMAGNVGELFAPSTKILGKTYNLEFPKYVSQSATKFILSDAPLTFAKAFPHVATGMVKANLANYQADRFLDQINIDEEAKKDINTTKNMMVDSYAFNSPIFGITKGALDLWSDHISHISEPVKYGIAGMAEGWTPRSILPAELKGVNGAGRAIQTARNLSTGLLFGGTHYLTEDYPYLGLALNTAILPGFQRQLDRRIFNIGFNSAMAATGASSAGEAINNVKRNTYLWKLASNNSPLKPGSETYTGIYTYLYPRGMESINAANELANARKQKPGSPGGRNFNVILAPGNYEYMQDMAYHYGSDPRYTAEFLVRTPTGYELRRGSDYLAELNMGDYMNNPWVRTSENQLSKAGRSSNEYRRVFGDKIYVAKDENGNIPHAFYETPSLTYDLKTNQVVPVTGPILPQYGNRHDMIVGSLNGGRTAVGINSNGIMSVLYPDSWGMLRTYDSDINGTGTAGFKLTTDVKSFIESLKLKGKNLLHGLFDIGIPITATVQTKPLVHPSVATGKIENKQLIQYNGTLKTTSGEVQSPRQLNVAFEKAMEQLQYPNSKKVSKSEKRKELEKEREVLQEELLATDDYDKQIELNEKIMKIDKRIETARSSRVNKETNERVTKNQVNDDEVTKIIQEIASNYQNPEKVVQYLNQVYKRYKLEESHPKQVKANNKKIENYNTALQLGLNPTQDLAEFNLTLKAMEIDKTAVVQIMSGTPKLTKSGKYHKSIIEGLEKIKKQLPEYYEYLESNNFIDSSLF